MEIRSSRSAAAFAAWIFLVISCATGGASAQTVQPDVRFVPTPQKVVERMLEMAEVKANDFLIDLGSGDGRIPITAAQRYGIRAKGIDIDPARIGEAERNAAAAGVTDRVSFRRGDLFETNISEATVVTLYLLEGLNLKLRPKLLRELKPGTRIVSHAFSMGDWKPEKRQKVGASTIYMWRVPGRNVGRRASR